MPNCTFFDREQDSWSTKFEDCCCTSSKRDFDGFLSARGDAFNIYHRWIREIFQKSQNFLQISRSFTEKHFQFCLCTAGSTIEFWDKSIDYCRISWKLFPWNLVTISIFGLLCNVKKNNYEFSLTLGIFISLKISKFLEVFWWVFWFVRLRFLISCAFSYITAKSWGLGAGSNIMVCLRWGQR